MIVVAIIGILAAVALPAYQDYTVRAKISEVVLAGSTCRTTVSEVYQSGSALPSAGEWGCEVGGTGTGAAPSTKYVQAVTTSDAGVITVTTTADASLPSAAQGKSIVMTPLDSSGAALAATAAGGVVVSSWKCGPAATNGLPAKYLPGTCRG